MNHEHILRAPIVLLLLGPAHAQPSPALPPIDLPRVLRPDIELELFSREPDIVTPVAIDVDLKGRVWAIESNTHFPKEDYTRHPSDRILVIEDENLDGKADRFQVFTDGLQQTMALALRGKGAVYVATRREVMVFEDSDGDLRPEKTTTIARLETVEEYPHNGLSGFAFDAEGWLHFAIGENMAVPYRLTGTDGAYVTGGPEGGSIFRMRPDGTRLSRWALGFWNTFHMAFDGAGNLFAVDNDPDSRPPCRLLHIVRGGDYGYRRWLGRKGLHPFTAWNGELPGTLPMVSGTGEAPSGVVWYDRGEGEGKANDTSALPADLRGKLILTSWGDHRIEVHALEQRGASFRSHPVPIVEGGEMFRPVGMAIAPDGSVFFSDWVDQEYHVHGKGRIWRIRGRSRSATPAAGSAGDSPKTLDSRKATFSAAAARLEALQALAEAPLASPKLTSGKAFEILGTERDPFLECTAVNVLARGCGMRWLFENRGPTDPRRRLLVLLALRRAGDAAAREAIDGFLADPDPEVRRAAIQWIGEERLTEHLVHLEHALESGPVSRALFEAWLAAMSLLAGEAPDVRDTVASDEFLLSIARGKTWPASIRATALRSVSPLFPALDATVLKGFLAEHDPAIRLEALRSLRESPVPEAHELLRALAESAAEPVALRREAIAGLARFLPGSETALKRLASDGTPAIRREAERVLRFGPLDLDAVPAKAVLTPGEQSRLLEGGDPAEGELLFFHPRGPRCSSCHSVRGRGGAAGPDLSAAGYTPRAKLLESILEPQKEIAPQFVTWVIVTRDGPRTGTIVGEGPDGSVRLASASGAVEIIPREAIESRTMEPTSLMPEGIAGQLTVEELRSVLAFLDSLR